MAKFAPLPHHPTGQNIKVQTLSTYSPSTSIYIELFATFIVTEITCLWVVLMQSQTTRAGNGHTTPWPLSKAPDHTLYHIWYISHTNDCTSKRALRTRTIITCCHHQLQRSLASITLATACKLLAHKLHLLTQYSHIYTSVQSNVGKTL